MSETVIPPVVDPRVASLLADGELAEALTRILRNPSLPHLTSLVPILSRHDFHFRIDFDLLGALGRAISKRRTP